MLASAAAHAATTDTLSLSSANYGAQQNIGVKLVTVSRTGDATGPATVICTTANNTASAGLQYTAVTQTLTWASGATTPQNCHIPILNTTPFTGTRTFFVALSSPTGATLGAIAQSTVTVYGDQPNSQVALSSAAYSATQNAGSLTITVPRTGYLGGKASVGYATADGSAAAGSDYTATRGQLTWNYGDGASKSFAIPISNAAPFSGTKTLTVALAGATGTSIGTAAANVSIAGSGTVTTPTVPSGLAASAGNAQATLTWSAASRATSYHVKRSTTSGGPYAQVGAPTSASFTDTALSNGTTYQYVVSALDSAGESANSAQVSAMPAVVTANACGMQLGDAPVMFCDTFDAPAGTGGRAGALNGDVWGVSRTIGDVNLGQLDYNAAPPTTLQGCAGPVVVRPPNDVTICNGQLREATNDNPSNIYDAGVVTALGMYPKQPFDFTGRTGTVSFDVSNDTHGNHAAWPEFWMSDLPVPVPFTHFATWLSLPQNAFGLRFAGSAAAGQYGLCPTVTNQKRWTVDSAVVIRNYVLDDDDEIGNAGFGTRSAMKIKQLDCVVQPPDGSGLMNHIEIRISQGQIDVYATDAGVAATQATLKHIAVVTNANLSFTHGLIWLEDVHYNADKAEASASVPSQRQHTFIWDNVAFDGPFTYRDFAYDALDANQPGPAHGTWNLGKVSSANQTSSWNVLNVPANPHPAAVRVLFNFHNELAPTPTVLTAIVNGHAHSVPWPFPEKNQNTWRTFAITIPVTDLVAGINVVQLGSDSTQITSNVDMVLVNVPGGVPVLPGSNDAYPGIQ